jgi:hypothetical protein
MFSGQRTREPAANVRAVFLRVYLKYPFLRMTKLARPTPRAAYITAC